MNLVLDIVPSLEFWRRIYPTDRSPQKTMSVPTRDCAYKKADVNRMKPDWVDDEFLKPLGNTLDVLVFDDAKRRQSKTHATHAWTFPVPEGSFFDLGNGVLIASPAFIFLVAASFLDVLQLIALGDELCGFYSFDSSAKRGFRRRSSPLATIGKLGHILAAAPGVRGQRKASCALKHVVERSASPMETFDEMALCLPYRYGGYGIAAPEMNYPVPLNPKASRIARRQTCYADMCWPKQMIDAEHHGQLDHESQEARLSDRARVNGLKEMGYEVVELTGDQVNDLFAFEYIALRIARMLGKRIDGHKLGATTERLQLRREIHAWNASSGCLHTFR